MPEQSWFRRGPDLIKFIVRITVLTALFLCFAACGRSTNSAALGTLTVNLPGLDGTLPAGSTRIYTLQGIVQNQRYTVQTQIPVVLQPDGSETPDGTLSVVLYESEDAYKNNLPPEPISVVPSTRFPYVYEGSFIANSSGEYVAALSGTSSTNPNTQFFYDLRLMSADPAYLTTFVTPTVPAYNAPINTDILAIYNGGNVTTSGNFSLRLSSSSTTTLGYPQLFVYADNTLTLDTLLFSSVSDTMNFDITSFLTPTGTGVTTLLPVDVISGVTLTSMGNGPYIVVRGVNSVTFTLDIGP